MAPLCELYIPFNQYSDQPVQKHIDLCNMVLNSTLTGLEIPDPNDREFRIRDSGCSNGIDVDEKKAIKVSYTYGADEYSVGKIFNPSDKDVTKIANDIFNKSKESGVDNVIFQGFRDSLFVNLSSGMEVNRNITIPKGLKKGISTGSVRLFLSPKIVEDSGIEDKNKWHLTFSGEFNELAEKICSILGSHSIFVVSLLREAETDLGVEIKLDTILREKKLSKEEMGFLGERVKQKILESGLMSRNGERSGNLWIKQGLPSLTVIAE